MTIATTNHPVLLHGRRATLKGTARDKNGNTLAIVWQGSNRMLVPISSIVYA